jgi:hypothetical protein
MLLGAADTETGVDNGIPKYHPLLHDMKLSRLPGYMT